MIERRGRVLLGGEELLQGGFLGGRALEDERDAWDGCVGGDGAEVLSGAHSWGA
ncbi:hypothetical protein RBB78_18700 [Tunturiibacter empetritectus]